jgi:molecular chaperone DnaJ
MFQAALGTTVEIDTLEGTGELKIDAGVQPGDVVLRRGEGIPVLGGRGRGDHHVHVQVVVPKKLSSDQEKALRDIADERGETVAEPRKGLLENLRKLVSD